MHATMTAFRPHSDRLYYQFVLKKFVKAARVTVKRDQGNWRHRFSITHTICVLSNTLHIVGFCVADRTIMEEGAVVAIQPTIITKARTVVADVLTAVSIEVTAEAIMEMEISRIITDPLVLLRILILEIVPRNHILSQT